MKCPFTFQKNIWQFPTGATVCTDNTSIHLPLYEIFIIWCCVFSSKVLAHNPNRVAEKLQASFPLIRVSKKYFSSLFHITLIILALNRKVLLNYVPLISGKISVIKTFRNWPFSKTYLTAKCSKASSIKDNTCGLTTPWHADRNNQLQKPILAPLQVLAGHRTAVILHGLNFRSLVAVWTDLSDTPDCAAKRIKELIRPPCKREPI